MLADSSLALVQGARPTAKRMAGANVLRLRAGSRDPGSKARTRKRRPRLATLQSDHGKNTIVECIRGHRGSCPSRVGSRLQARPSEGMRTQRPNRALATNRPSNHSLILKPQGQCGHQGGAAWPRRQSEGGTSTSQAIATNQAFLLSCPSLLLVDIWVVTL
jgi:hypothetical protein